MEHLYKNGNTIEKFVTANAILMTRSENATQTLIDVIIAHLVFVYYHAYLQRMLSIISNT